MTHGTDAIIPMEVDEPLTRRTHFDEALNNENLAFELYMIDKVRNHAYIEEEACKRRATQKHESKLKRREF